jgi:two-component system, NtrC family, sensor kinase
MMSCPAAVAARLPWIAPGAQAALAWTEEPPKASDILNDPASLLMLVRYQRPMPTIANVHESDLQASAVPEAIAEYLMAGVAGTLDHRHPTVRMILKACRQLSLTAESLAKSSGIVNPIAARIAACTAPLGWLALASVNADAVAGVLADPDWPSRSVALECAKFGNSVDAVTRRLSARWKLPLWLSNFVDNLRLTSAEAVRLGADPDLNRVVRMAIAVVDRSGHSLGLTGLPELVAIDDGVPVDMSDDIADSSAASWPLLPRLLKAVAKARRLANSPTVHRAESTIDHLHESLRAVERRFEQSLQNAKLASLAEFAAGAGHEINNPLAVISGNAQRLRNREDDSERRRALDTIIAQTGKIALILREVMAFARPAKPRPQVVRVGIRMPPRPSRVCYGRLLMRTMRSSKLIAARFSEHLAIWSRMPSSMLRPMGSSEFA